MTVVFHDLVRDFDQAMMQIYVHAKEQEGYTSTRFYQMLTKHRCVETARRLLPQMSDDRDIANKEEGSDEFSRGREKIPLPRRQDLGVGVLVGSRPASVRYW